MFFFQKQAESQVPKKKKKVKKSKIDGNDSGVEVYFREEEDKEDEKEPQRDSVNVREYAAAQYFYCHTTLQRLGKLISLSRSWKINFMSSLYNQVRQSSAGPSRLQVAAGFSWDVGLSSLKPASVVQEGDSSDGEDQDGSSKVSLRMHICPTTPFSPFLLGSEAFPATKLTSRLLFLCLPAPEKDSS